QLTDALLIASGAITSIPLVFFGQAARKLRLSTLGFLQFLAPTMQFALAIWVFDEPYEKRIVGFLIVWVAVIVFVADSLLTGRSKPATQEEPEEAAIDIAG